MTEPQRKTPGDSPSPGVFFCPDPFSDGGYERATSVFGGEEAGGAGVKESVARDMKMDTAALPKTEHPASDAKGRGGWKLVAACVEGAVWSSYPGAAQPVLMAGRHLDHL